MALLKLLEQLPPRERKKLIKELLPTLTKQEIKTMSRAVNFVVSPLDLINFCLEKAVNLLYWLP